ncbi:MAG: protein-disulfide reductase DsbD [Pseudomonadota bacterium]
MRQTWLSLWALWLLAGWEMASAASETSSPLQTVLGSALFSLPQKNLKGLAGLDNDEPLDPHDAFRFQAEVRGPHTLEAHWRIADGTFLYREKLRLELKDSPGVALGAFEWPPAENKHDTVRVDGSIGTVAIYHQAIDVTLPLLRGDSFETEVTLVAHFQGCAERGICYPPMTETVTLRLPATASLQRITAIPPPLSEQDRVFEHLRTGSLGGVLASFFGFGLLLAFTPCVFPMIPILSGIIVGQTGQGRRRVFGLSVVYVLAMALTYAMAGVLAGLLGQNLQASFQHPIVLVGFALVFLTLALSLFGLYDLQLPAAWQGRLSEVSRRQTGGAWVGVAAMGVLSALIVGPCVAPPLAGALLYIGQTGDALLGGLALFILGLGIGAPLLLIGASAGQWLPRAGAWMEPVKALFGVFLLAVAISLLERLLPAAITMGLWGSLLIVSSVYLDVGVQLPITASGWTRARKGLGYLLVIYGSLILAGAAAGGKDPIRPLQGTFFQGARATGETLTEIRFRRIKTRSDLDQALQEAKAAGQPVMLDFYADWCASCVEMARETFSDPRVKAALAGFVTLQADVTANDADDRALLFGRLGLPGPPAIFFFGSDGVERRPLRVVGFQPASEFLKQIQGVTP